MARTQDATPVRDADGQTGWLDGPFTPDAPLDVRLDSGQRLRLAAGLVQQKPSGELRTRVSFADLIDEADLADEAALRSDAPLASTGRLPTRADAEVFQEIQESIDVRRVVREAERVRILVTTGQTTETVSEPTWQDHVEIRREPVGQVVTAVEDVRTEDGVTVVPVYEEVLVVERRLVLRERLHVSVQREATETRQEVTLRHQSVDVARAEPADEH